MRQSGSEHPAEINVSDMKLSERPSIQPSVPATSYTKNATIPIKKNAIKNVNHPSPYIAGGTIENTSFQGTATKWYNA